MKKLFILLISLFIVQNAIASEGIISFLVINNIDEREIEVIMNKEKMYLPCKYILGVLEIPFKENHVEKSLYFNNACVKNGALYVDGKKQNYQAFFINNGMTGIKNEFFLPAEALASVTGKEITADPRQLIAYINSKDLNIQEKKSDENAFLVIDKTPKIQAHQEVTLPKKKSGWITLDSVGFSNNMMSDSYSQVYKEASNSNLSFMNNSKVTFAGKLKQGDYKVDVGTNTYTNNFFAFSGISPQYKTHIDKYDFIAGKAEPWAFGGNGLSNDLMGVQVKDHVDKKITYRDIQGYVDPKSTVKVSINNDFSKELSTYGGYFSLKDIYYNGKVENVKVEELLADGTKKDFLTKNFKGADDKIEVPENDILFGITGLQNRLCASNGYLYQNNTKKFASGGKYTHEINDKLTFENLFMGDRIISAPQNSDWSRSILGNRKYLNFTTMKNYNMLEGQTYMGLFTYKHNEKLKSKLYFGGSTAVSQDTITPAGSGLCLNYENNYQANKDNSLKSSLFAYSSNFYSAGSSSGSGNFLSDRVGASLTGNTKLKNTTISGTYSKYQSNFGKVYDGGLMNFDEYNFISRTTFKKAPSLMLRVNSKNGANGLGAIASNSYELSTSKRLKCFCLNGGVRNNSYSNQYNAKDYSSYKSEYSSIYTDANFPIGKRFGSGSFGHEIVSTKSDANSDSYKVVRIGYSTPPLNGTTLSFQTGYHYTGLNKGLDFGAGIMKRLKSGSAISLNYRFNRSPCYIIENMYIPSTMRHSITMDFSELYGVSDGGLQALGTSNIGKGFLQASAFLDINKNGIQDKGEPNIENIAVKIENDSEPFLTNKKGKTSLRAEDSGVYRVELFEDELPTFLSVHNKTQPSRYIKINDKEKTDIAFGLISSVGNINGTVCVKDEYNNPMIMKDVVVSVLDTDGQEVNYTNLNEDGSFSISGLNPGKYFVEIDKGLQEMYHLKPEKESQNYTVEIPPEYKDYVNIDNVNLSYKYIL